MLVYGDRARPVEVQARLESIESLIRAPRRGGVSEDRLMLALLEAGELAQGLIDEEYAATGYDDFTALHSMCMELLGGIAQAALTGRLAVPERVGSILSRLAGADLPNRVDCKVPEGFAFYGVYPQAYALAASRCYSTSPPLIIGLRSIGTTLAAAAASTCGGAAVTLRPRGHPFDREVRVSEGLRERLAGHRGTFIIADEGPGLSGSSFVAAAERLEELGVAEDRIIFLPSHHGAPGLQADDRRRARWRRADRVAVTFDDLGAESLLRRWFEDLVGPLLRIEDLSGGAWRDANPSADRPPAWPAHERRKFRLTTEGGAYLARFAGLGAYGEAKLKRAQILHGSGVTPEPIGLRGGFLLERWVEGVPPQLNGNDRAAFLRVLGAYLGLRARDLQAEPWEGASLGQLCEMVRVNAKALGGQVLLNGLEPVLTQVAALRSLCPVHVDGQLQGWEWRRTSSGGFCKTDALDHSNGHDLVGCQDIAWDIAGAACEFELTPAEATSLSEAVAETSGRPVVQRAVMLFQVCYDAFKAGVWSMAAADPAEADRAGKRRDFHRRRLERIASG